MARVLRSGARIQAIPIAQLVDRAVDRSAGGARASIAGTVAAREAIRGVKHRIVRHLPRSARARMWRWLGEPPAKGRVSVGDFGSVVPISRDFGFDRGTPIDRYYIERFLERHAGRDRWPRARSGWRRIHATLRRAATSPAPTSCMFAKGIRAPRSSAISRIPQCFRKAHSIASSSPRRSI